MFSPISFQRVGARLRARRSAFRLARAPSATSRAVSDAAAAAPASAARARSASRSVSSAAAPRRARSRARSASSRAEACPRASPARAGSRARARPRHRARLGERRLGVRAFPPLLLATCFGGVARDNGVLEPPRVRLRRLERLPEPRGVRGGVLQERLQRVRRRGAHGARAHPLLDCAGRSRASRTLERRGARLGGAERGAERRRGCASPRRARGARPPLDGERFHRGGGSVFSRDVSRSSPSSAPNPRRVSRRASEKRSLPQARLRGFVVQTSARGAKRLVRARLSTPLCTAAIAKSPSPSASSRRRGFRFFRLGLFFPSRGVPRARREGKTAARRRRERRSRAPSFPAPASFWTSSENVSAASRLDAAIAFVRGAFLVAACAGALFTKLGSRSSSETRACSATPSPASPRAPPARAESSDERERARASRRDFASIKTPRAAASGSLARAAGAADRRARAETTPRRVARGGGDAPRPRHAPAAGPPRRGRGRPGCCADARRLEGTRGPGRRSPSRASSAALARRPGECERRRRGDATALLAARRRRASLACRESKSGRACSGALRRLKIREFSFAEIAGCRAFVGGRKKRSAFRSMTPRVAEQDEKARAFRGRTWRCALSDATLRLSRGHGVAAARRGHARVRASRCARRERARRGAWCLVVVHAPFFGRPSTWTAGWSLGARVTRRLRFGRGHARARARPDDEAPVSRAWCLVSVRVSWGERVTRMRAEKLTRRLLPWNSCFAEFWFGFGSRRALFFGHGREKSGAAERRHPTPRRAASFSRGSAKSARGAPEAPSGRRGRSTTTSLGDAIEKMPRRRARQLRERGAGSARRRRRSRRSSARRAGTSRSGAQGVAHAAVGACFAPPPRSGPTSPWTRSARRWRRGARVTSAAGGPPRRPSARSRNASSAPARRGRRARTRRRETR